MKAMFARARQITFFFLLLLLMSQSSMAQFQGKIFTTPEERAYLDALREDFLKKSQDQGFDIDEAGPPPLPETDRELTETTTAIEYSLGGILTRSDGSHTVWLNNQPVAETDLAANMRLVSDGQLVVLRIETAAGRFQLKPGQTLNASTGEIQEAYQRVAPRVEDVTASATASNTEAALPSSQVPFETGEALPASAVSEAAAEADSRETP